MVGEQTTTSMFMSSNDTASAKQCGLPLTRWRHSTAALMVVTIIAVMSPPSVAEEPLSLDIDRCLSELGTKPPNSARTRDAILRIRKSLDALHAMLTLAVHAAEKAFPGQRPVECDPGSKAWCSVDVDGVLGSLVRCTWDTGWNLEYSGQLDLIMAVRADAPWPAPNGARLDCYFPFADEMLREMRSVPKARLRMMRALESEVSRASPRDSWYRSGLLDEGDSWEKCLPAARPPQFEVPSDQLSALAAQVMEDPNIGELLPSGALDLLASEAGARQRAVQRVRGQYEHAVRWLLDRVDPPRTVCGPRELVDDDLVDDYLSYLGSLDVQDSPFLAKEVTDRLLSCMDAHRVPYVAACHVHWTTNSSDDPMWVFYPGLWWMIRSGLLTTENLVGEIVRPANDLRPRLAAYALCYCVQDVTTFGNDNSLGISEEMVSSAQRRLSLYLTAHPDLTEEQKHLLVAERDRMHEMIRNSPKGAVDWLPPLPHSK